MLGISGAYYVDYMLKFTGTRDIKMALTKGFVFGFLIVFIGSYEGSMRRKAPSASAGPPRKPSSSAPSPS